MNDGDASASTPAAVPMCADYYEDRGELSRFLYYVARDYKQKGKPCIRVVRTLLLDEGKQQTDELRVLHEVPPPQNSPVLVCLIQQV
jgi:hypothetical protein